LTSLLLVLSSCSSKTEHGECVGISDKQNPQLEYKPSARNIVLGVVFSEMIIPPVLVIFNQFYCPVGKKEQK
jgi:hypothetical protein